MPTGQTAIIVPVPEADPLVGAWRDRFDKHAAQGVPAHITLLSPFVAPEQLDAILPRLPALLAGAPAHYTLSRLRPWPGLAVLVPQPLDWFLAASRALCAHTGLRPYGGKHGDAIQPHLTVAYGDPDPQVERARFEAIAADLDPRLPLRCALDQAWLMQLDGARWVRRHVVPLRGPTSAAGRSPS